MDTWTILEFLVAELLSKATNRDVWSLYICICVYVCMYICHQCHVLMQFDSMLMYLYLSCLCNAFLCMCIFVSPTCTIVLQWRGQVVPPETIVSPLSHLGAV